MMTSKVVLHSIGIGAAFVLLEGCASGKNRASSEATVSATVAETPPPQPPAAAPVPPSEGFDWNVLARLAAANSAEAKALLLDANADRLKTAVDTGWRNPRLTTGSDWGEEDQTGTRTRSSGRSSEWQTRDSYSRTAALRIYATNPFVNRWLRQRGGAAAHAKDAEAQEAAYAVFCEVKSLCLEADIARREIELLQQTQALREQVCSLRREQTEAGMASGLQLIRAEARLAALRTDISERQTARQQLLRRIATLSGVPVDQLRLRPGDAAQPVKTEYLDESALTELALLRRPDLARAQRERDAATFAVRAARAGQIPWFEFVEAQYEQEDADDFSFDQSVSGYDRANSEETAWRLRVALTLPVFNWLGDELRLTRAELSASEARVHGLHNQIRAEVAGVLQDYRVARAEHERIAAERDRLIADFSARIDALADEPTVKREEVFAAREELIDYLRTCLKAEAEFQRLTQYLETVSGGPLIVEP